MKNIIVLILAIVFLANIGSCVSKETEAYKKAINDPAAAHLARPSASQYAWQEQERIMFVHFAPTTWQGREHDNHSTDLKDMKLPKLDTDQWCKAARSWGAKEILFVAKHTGGFCWWQTETTDYSVKNIAWKDGKGDLLKEISQSCLKNGLNLGIYVYPGDEQWGAGIGSGGRTSDPAKQEAYNKILRQQWTEVLSKYGKICEIWFDGSCVVPLGDIIKKYAPDAVIFQGPQATIRWPGTESGILPYPAWNSLSSKDLKTGTSTAVHGNPDGDAWAPLEADTPLYNHYWFWALKKEKKRKSLEQLLEIYYKSVGRGGVLLLNSTPTTDGLIPEGDMKRYQEFGDEIERRFAHPLAEISGTGNEHTIVFEKPTNVNQVVIMEDYRYGERIRKYSLLGKIEGGRWVKLNEGSSVGRKRIVVFSPATISQLRLKIDQSVGEPLIRSFKAYFVEDMNITHLADPLPAENPGKVCHTLRPEDFKGNKAEFTLDLSGFFTKPGQYGIEIIPDDATTKLKVTDFKVLYNDKPVLKEMYGAIQKNKYYNINRTAQVTEESKITLKMTLNTPTPSKAAGIIRIYSPTY